MVVMVALIKDTGRRRLMSLNFFQTLTFREENNQHFLSEKQHLLKYFFSSQNKARTNSSESVHFIAPVSWWEPLTAFIAA